MTSSDHQPRSNMAANCSCLVLRRTQRTTTTKLKKAVRLSVVVTWATNVIGVLRNKISSLVIENLRNERYPKICCISHAPGVCNHRIAGTAINEHKCTIRNCNLCKMLDFYEYINEKYIR